MTRALMLVIVLGLTSLAAGADPPIGETTVFARVPNPGMPEGIVVLANRVYVGTHASVRGNSGEGPSKIFVFPMGGGTPIDEIVVAGQASATHGLLGMTYDAAGRIYVLDRNPPRVLRINPDTDAQETYATIPDLPACRPTGPTTNCAPVTVDEPAFPDYLAFDPSGNLYVTDLQAATIFRVPARETGQSLPLQTQIWYQDARFDGIFGLNGIAVDASGTKLYFAMTGSQQPARPSQGIIYTLPLQATTPTAADLQEFHVYPEPATGPDGIAFGRSGRLYVALAGSNQVSILEPNGTEAARFPATPLDNALAEIPYDLPASIAFDGAGSILVTNQSFFAADPSHWAVLRAWVNDRALPYTAPTVP